MKKIWEVKIDIGQTQFGTLFLSKKKKLGIILLTYEKDFFFFDKTYEKKNFRSRLKYLTMYVHDDTFHMSFQMY